MLSWEELNHQCQHCQGCSLSQGHHVVGQGSPKAQVLCITHVPSQTGRVLTQAEEALLQDLITLAGVPMEQVYITSVVKCVAPIGRNVLHLERHTCLPWLRNQWALLQPKAIVCLGQEAAEAIMGIDLETHHGQWFARKGAAMMAMEHPGVLLRDGHKRPQGFLDAKALGQKAKQLRIL